MLWESEELRCTEEALPPLKMKVLTKAAAACKVSTGIGVDGFHSRVALDLSNECCERIHTMLHTVEMTSPFPHGQQCHQRDVVGEMCCREHSVRCWN